MTEEWRPYVVQQGDHLDKLAYRSGVEPSEIWEHEKNSDLTELRNNQATLYPGDLIFLPMRQAAGVDILPGQTNRYQAVIPTIPVSLTLHADGVPAANEAYEVHGIYPGDRVLDGTTNAAGEISIEVPVHVRELEVELVESGILVPVRVGDLDPIEERSGVIQRLRNLNFVSEQGEVDDEALTRAVSAFQGAQGLKRTGVADQQTREALGERHGT